MGNEPRHDRARTPANPNATRDHLANERTFLAWIRSCVAIMALGFVVARFGLLIREVAPRTPRHTLTALSTGIGVALVICGALLVLLATRRYRDTTYAIERGSYQPSSTLIMLLAGGFVLVAVLLAAYLLATA